MWTRPDDITAQLSGLWERGRILAAEIAGRSLFPLRLPIKAPRTVEIPGCFAEVRDWIALLQSSSKEKRGKGYRLEYRSTQSRRIGRNQIPDRAVVDSSEDATYLLRNAGELKRFGRMLSLAEEICPALIAFLEQKNVRALALSDDFEALLRTALWIFCNPNPRIYPRQIDLPGIDTKFLERHCKVLSEMVEILDVIPGRPLALRPGRATGLPAFCRKYGFLTEPLYVKFRVPPGNGFFPECVRELSLPAEEFAALAFPRGAIRNIFVVENKVNLLAFPELKNTMVIWGAGYCFDHIAGAGWLDECRIYYWGDIDTNGFAILDQFRARFPKARSFLMDLPTLLEHAALWVTEKTPKAGRFLRLDDEERQLYTALLNNTYGERVRLEQERVSYGRVLEAARAIEGS